VIITHKSKFQLINFFLDLLFAAPINLFVLLFQNSDAIPYRSQPVNIIKILFFYLFFFGDFNSQGLPAFLTDLVVHFIDHPHVLDLFFLGLVKHPLLPV
jgi:hypothetical protein